MSGADSSKDDFDFLMPQTLGVRVGIIIAVKSNEPPRDLV